MSHKLKYFFLALTLSSCGYTSYIFQSLYEGGKILAARNDIEDVLKDPAYTVEEKRRLGVVMKARAFAESMGLTPGESFTKYTKVDRDVLLWVLVALKPTSFVPYMWWFPVVGNVPYKGFFEKQEAIDHAESLKRDGYEYTIRGAQAFSTLGWFIDPVLSTTLNSSDTRIVNTVIHECVHSTVWAKGDVEFNESLANFVGFMGTIEFYNSDPEKLVLAIRERDREWEISDVTLQLYDRLNSLYASFAPEAIKLQLREKIFNETVAPLKTKYPELQIFKTLNNAEIIQLKLYMTGLRDFEQLLKDVGGDWRKFIVNASERAP